MNREILRENWRLLIESLDEIDEVDKRVQILKEFLEDSIVLEDLKDLEDTEE